MDERFAVLLDTDIGSDIDDAMALAYLLSEPRCELAGITTVTGNTAKRAALAQALCEAAGRGDVPIHCGASNVLLDGPGQPDVPQFAAIAARPHRLEWPQATAIEFLRQTIRSRPGELTLLSIGPLTNVALLFAIDPEVHGLLRAWYSMAGTFLPTTPRDSEWNSACDPLATAVAFRHRPPRRVHVGLDVTLACSLPADEVRNRCHGQLLGLVLDMAEVWFKDRDRVVFHDPLAAAAIFDPDLVFLRRGKVSVDPASGATHFFVDSEGPDEVAVSVDVPRFFDRFWSAFA